MPEIYRNGKLETVSDAEWRRVVEGNQAKQAARQQRVKKVANKGGKVRVTTEDGRTHEVKKIGSVSGKISNLIVGGSGPIHTGTGDMYVDGKKQKKQKRNPWW